MKKTRIHNGDTALAGALAGQSGHHHLPSEACPVASKYGLN